MAKQSAHSKKLDRIYDEAHSAKANDPDRVMEAAESKRYSRNAKRRGTSDGHMRHTHVPEEKRSQAVGEPDGVMMVKKVCKTCSKTLDHFLSK